MGKAKKPSKTKLAKPAETDGPAPHTRAPTIIDGMEAIAFSRLKMNPVEAVEMAAKGPFVVTINRKPALVVRSFLVRSKGRRPANERRKG